MAFNQDVEIVVKPRKKAGAPGRITLVPAAWVRHEVSLPVGRCA